MRISRFAVTSATDRRLKSLKETDSALLVGVVDGNDILVVNVVGCVPQDQGTEI